MLGWRSPTDLDPTGEWFTFEKGAEKLDGHDGFADVWMKDKFAWEYKGKRADLKAAYKQLNDYREDSATRPCWWCVTCFASRSAPTSRAPPRSSTPSPSTTWPLRPANRCTSCAPLHESGLSEADGHPPGADRGGCPGLRRPRHRAALRGHDPQAVAHFLDRLLFCLFAEDAGLLPAAHGAAGDGTRRDPAAFAVLFGPLRADATKGGGLFGVERIECSTAASSTARGHRPHRAGGGDHPEGRQARLGGDRAGHPVTGWWKHERPRVDMRAALAGLGRFVATPNLAKHRLFVWSREAREAVVSVVDRLVTR